ncbi:MAG TPA: PA14 domain-containing protein [Planctomycetota bacterium]|nr:PA14 domain-containing protein [Planctomycetota bacterium]
MSAGLLAVFTGLFALRPAAPTAAAAIGVSSPTIGISAADAPVEARIGAPAPSEVAPLNARCDEFDAWADAYVAARDAATMDAPRVDEAAPADAAVAGAAAPAERAGPGADRDELERGRIAAAARRDALRRLIRVDPRAAIAQAVPYRVRRALPDDIRAQLETPISARGDLQVAVAMPTDGGASTISRAAVIGDDTFAAHVYGWRRSQITSRDIPLQGIALDGELAVDESSVRRLSDVEIADRDVAVDAACPVSGAPGVADVVVEVAGEFHPLCSAGHITTLDESIRAGQGGDGSATVAPAPPTSWTTGPKTVLYMRVDFSDRPGEPVSVATASSAMAQVDAFFRANSYGATSLTTTYTPVLRMPQTVEYYRTRDVQLLTDARAVAAAAGYNTNGYSLDIVAHAYIYGWAGQGYVGWRGTWLNGYFDFRVTAHELGHNYGLWHANAWRPTDGTPNNAGYHEEYGEPFDTMGTNGSPERHFNAYEKNVLGWLSDARVQTVTTSGTYRILPHDTTSSGIGAIRIRESTGNDYWFSTRALTATSGIHVHRFYPGIQGSGSQILDLTPSSGDGVWDAPMVPGATLTDPSPVAISATTVRMYADGSADLQVSIGANRLPIGSVASALDGDNVVGWTLDPDTAASSNQVRIVFDGNQDIAVQVTASVPRPDVNQSTGYPGDHGFIVPVPAALRDGAQHRARAYGIDSATGAQVDHGEVVFTLGGGGGTGDGLTAVYHDDMGLADPRFTRVDPTIDFDWGSGSPDQRIGADTFSVRWTGSVEAVYSEQVEFITTSDDGVRLWIDGQLVIDQWTNHPPTQHSGVITLTAGRRHALRMEFFENGGGATARLEWRSARQARQVVPRGRLFSGGGIPEDGDGALATYFNDVALQSPALTRVDERIDFDWGGGAPASGIGADRFSVRWTAEVVARHSGVYQFITTSDDGVRLWIDGALIIDQWNDHGPTQHVGQAQLTAGGRHALRMEFYENGGGAVARLEWQSALQQREIVPRGLLHSGGTSEDGNGATATYYAGMAFQELLLTRVDPRIDFDWGGGSPAPAIAADRFSARWTAQLQPRHSEEYELITTSDDGIRVWVDGVLIIDQWNDHAPTQHVGRVRLNAGDRHELRVDFYENGGGAVAKLEWASASQPRELVPQSCLFSTAGGFAAR